MQYLSFATLGTILCWKLAELLSFEVDVKKLWTDEAAFKVDYKPQIRLKTMNFQLQSPVGFLLHRNDNNAFLASL